MLALSTWQLLKEFHDSFMAEVQPQIEGAEVGVAPVVMVLADMPDEPRHYGQLSAVPLSAELMYEQFQSDEGKANVAEFIRKVMTPGTVTHDSFIDKYGVPPFAVMVLVESWVSMSHGEKPQFDCLPVDDPQRKEAAMVTIHTDSGPIVLTHFMERAPEGSGVPRKLQLAEFPTLEVCHRMKVSGNLIA